MHGEFERTFLDHAAEGDILDKYAKLIRPELLPILETGKQIRRHVHGGQEKVIVDDNVYAHKLRCVVFIDSLDIPVDVKEDAIKTILLHDLPEIAVLAEKSLDHDLTAWEKVENPELASQVEEEEQIKASEMFTPEELELIANLRPISSFLKGEDVDPNDLNPSAKIAEITDKIDAGVISHQHISNWVKSDEYRPDNFPPLSALTLLFGLHRQFQENLSKLPDNETAVLCRELSVATVKFAKSFWDDVPKDRIPSGLSEYLKD